VLYGTTTAGGGSTNGGTVFSVTPGGIEHLLHSFTGGDGLNPYSNLILFNHVLYGTTYRGGAHGLGVVFSLAP
jgi:uncharacterized repeat protein (TIGR03803 family)